MGAEELADEPGVRRVDLDAVEAPVWTLRAERAKPSTSSAIWVRSIASGIEPGSGAGTREGAHGARHWSMTSALPSLTPGA